MSAGGERPAAVLLDALGTLVHLQPPGPRLRASLASRLGLEVGADRAQAAMQAEMRHYRAHCVRAHDDATLAALRLECADVLADALAADVSGPEVLPCLTDALVFTLYDDVVPALTALSTAGLRLAVVSNWDVSLLTTLERLRIADRFEAIVYSAEVGASKPDPRPFSAALDRLGITADEAVHVGDDEVADRQGATAAGVRAIVIHRRSPPPPGDIASLAELPERLGS
jgi:putative hydrolase of the HAD superfamily